MIGLKGSNRKKGREEGERPFWISYADLMTSLMVLFLVATTAGLNIVKTKKTDAENKASEEAESKKKREEEISQLLNQIEARKTPGISIHGHTIDFGDRARFELNSHKLTNQQANLIRNFIPIILEQARSELGRKWLKRVVVEGYADKSGTYIHNLNLSMQRSERIMCILLSPPKIVRSKLNDDDRLTIRKLFLVGGSSYNSLKQNPKESRRVEFKLEFFEKVKELTNEIPDDLLDNDPRCPLDEP